MWCYVYNICQAAHKNKISIYHSNFEINMISGRRGNGGGVGMEGMEDGQDYSNLPPNHWVGWN